jgi:hypothetical protein
VPKPIRGFPRDKFDGSVVELRGIDGETSGRFTVAQVVARVFPAHGQFVHNVIEMFDFFAPEVTYSPFPDDTLTYRMIGSWNIKQARTLKVSARRIGLPRMVVQSWALRF